MSESGYIDISVPIRSGMFVYDGNPGVSLTRSQSIAAGDAANVSRLDFGVHTGTHVDAPLHFIEGGGDAAAIPVDALLGDAYVVDATALTADIDRRSLAELEFPRDARRLLFKTRNSRLWSRRGFTRDFIRFRGDAAADLVATGVTLVGIDYLSIGDAEAHEAFLRAGVVPLEGVNLETVEPGRYRLICTALRLAGSDGAPARALLLPAGG